MLPYVGTGYELRGRGGSLHLGIFFVGERRGGGVSSVILKSVLPYGMYSNTKARFLRVRSPISKSILNTAAGMLNTNALITDTRQNKRK